MQEQERYLRVAAGFFSAGDFHGAEHAGFLAAAADPHNVNAWILLGAALAKQKRYADATRVLECAARLRPDDIARWVDVAECQLLAQRYRPAAAALRRALALDPDGVHPAGRRARAMVGRTLVQLRKAS